MFKKKENSENIHKTLEFVINPGVPNLEVTNTVDKINSINLPSSLFTTSKEVCDIIRIIPMTIAHVYNNKIILNSALKLQPKIVILKLTYICRSCMRLFYFPHYFQNPANVMIPKAGKDHKRKAIRI